VSSKSTSEILYQRIRSHKVKRKLLSYNIKQNKFIFDKLPLMVICFNRILTSRKMSLEKHVFTPVAADFISEGDEEI
jgi:hypothetical protein